MVHLINDGHDGLLLILKKPLATIIVILYNH